MREREIADKHSMEREHQMGFFGMIITFGLLLIAVGLFDSDMWPLAIIGGLLVLAIVLWIWTDKRILTQDEELEQTLIDTAKRHRRLGSMSAVLDEYRAEGASELTISRARNAGPQLRQRARASLGTGLLSSGLGTTLLCGCVAVLIRQTDSFGHFDQHTLQFAFIGASAGLYHIMRGLRLHWYARQFTSTRLAKSPQNRPEFGGG